MIIKKIRYFAGILKKLKKFLRKNLAKVLKNVLNKNNWGNFAES